MRVLIRLAACFATSVVLITSALAQSNAVTSEIVIDLTGSGAAANRGDATYCSFFGKDWKQPNVVSPAVPTQFYNAFNDNVDLIKKYARVNREFDVRVANVPNAAAVISRQNKKYLLFNQNFLTSIKTFARNRQAFKIRDKAGRTAKLITGGARDDWLVMSVVSHEVGHHLAGHTLKLGNQPYNELQADWFTGYLLKKMGAPLIKAREMQGLGSACGTLTHPLQKDRLAAVTSGWVQACEEDSECNAARIDLAGGEECKTTASIQSANQSRPSVIRTAKNRTSKTKKYDLICKLRDNNYLVSSGAVYKNSFDFSKNASVWKVAGDMAFTACSTTARLADGEVCLRGSERRGGVLLEGSLINADIPVGVCAPCAPGVCPTTG